MDQPSSPPTYNDALSITKRLPGGLLVAILIGFVAATPMIRGLPESAGHLIHLYRAVHLHSLFQNGILYSRWLPDLGFGYGYPLFNYYAPLSYYLVELLNFFAPNLVAAYLGVYVLAFIITSLFTYLWVNTVFDQPAALVAAALSAFSPYLLEDSFHQGALAEIFALALIPLILWAFRQVLGIRRWYYALIAILSYASLILSHNISALIFTPFLIAYVFIVAYTQPATSGNRLRSTLRQFLPALLLLFLALALTAFFWFPALAERHLVQIDQLINPVHFNYDVNFLEPGDLLALPFVSDPYLVLQPIPNGLSLIAILLGLMGLIGAVLYRYRPEQLAHILFAGFVVFGSAFMSLSFSAAIWEHVPLLPFLQFPHRFLGLTTLFLALLAGVGTINLMNLFSKWRRLFVAIPVLVIGVIALYALPWSFVDFRSPPPPATIAGSADFERRSGAVGTTSAGEYLPVSVLELPPNPFDPSGLGGRLDLNSLPATAQVTTADYRSLAYEIEIDSPEPFSAIFNTFYFGGWQATIDGHPTHIQPTQPFGLISVNVPEGQHTLAIRFSSTAIRLLASILSWLSLLFLIPTVLLLYRGKPSTELQSAEAQNYGLLLALVASVLLLILTLKFTYLDRGESILQRSPFDGEAVLSADRQLFADFEDQMFLLGADIPQSVIADAGVPITLYWQVTDRVDREYSVSTVLLDNHNMPVGQSDNQHPGTIPTTDWQPDEYALDKHDISLIPGTPPGIYDLQVNVYEYGRPDNRLNLLDENGAPAGQSFTVGSLAVDRPGVSYQPDDINPLKRVDSFLADNLSLVGFTIPRHAIRTGDPLYLELFWQSTANIDRDLDLFIELSEENGKVIYSEATSPVPGYPTSLWQSGDLWRGLHPILIPATLASGDYQITLRTGTEEQFPLGMAQITAADHTMTKPPFTYSNGTRFGQVAQLVGYDLPQEVSPGSQLPISLIWQVLNETQTSYKVFVQLLDANGQLVAGSDAIPANWDRPTTGWIAGEYIVDAHTLSLPAGLPPGSYALLVGLYDASDGQRLLTTMGDDAVYLSQSLKVRE